MTAHPTLNQIFIAEIDFSNRLRPADPAQIELLAESIGRLGLIHPVMVRRVTGGKAKFRLVSGLHRIEAMRMLGHEVINAIITTMDQSRAEIVEIDENLTRRDLAALDKAALVASRLAHWDAVYGYSHGGDRRSAAARKSKCHRDTLLNSKNGNDLLTAGDASRLDAALKSVSGDVSSTFSEATAEQIGLSRRSIYRLLSIESRIDPQLRADLRAGAPAKFTSNINQLYRLSREAPTLQRQIAELIIAGRVGNVAAAIRMLTGKATPRPDRMTAALNMLLALPDHDLRALMQRVADTIRSRVGIRITEGGND